MESCPIIQVDPGMMEVDCEPCPQKMFCGFRSNSLKERYRMWGSRLDHIVWLHELIEVGHQDAIKLGWELRGLIIFRRALEKVRDKKLELEMEQITAKANKNARS